ncbi:glycosyl hydrolase family 28 protein [Metabacillus bambusae]|uniref:Right-handed parallel beta-helix repeat-containing protein n=1 Tax=Metabacillus bambusae TaxID=2795218 RepID=A0ABS3NAJ8_9BACI|nr:glycosyl hydrolase family 28 protein [Metabacillus bambusae]MBO1515312.1 right-handed parallel beta-helix repeat-containing protein [Metabacillus bambusae]
MSILKTFPAPKEAVCNNDFSVRVREVGGEWKQLSIYEVKVDMHNVRKASMVQFDMEGIIEVEITCNNTDEVKDVTIRPLSYKISYEQYQKVINMKLDHPCKLSIEINGDRFHNLHLFANPIEKDHPNSTHGHVVVIEPGIHLPDDIVSLATEPNSDKEIPNTVYFAPGYHYLIGSQLLVPSGKTIYLAGGSVVVGSFVCDSVQDVTIRGRGIIYLADIEKTTYFRGIQIESSKNITIDGIIVVDPPHYSILIGQSSDIKINNFKSFSTRGWSDGIDMMSSTNINVNYVFMRNSDDCIAIYGSRGDFFGDTKNVQVKNSILWADVAHPINIGTHGDHGGNGDTIENIHFENIDILEHHEPQENYWGAMSINAGDRNVIKNIIFENIRVEDFELGQLLDIRVVFNKKYNPVPGNKIQNITFKNIEYNGKNEKSSRIHGYDSERTVEDVSFSNLRINGRAIRSVDSECFEMNEYAHNITFESNIELAK